MLSKKLSKKYVKDRLNELPSKLYQRNTFKDEYIYYTTYYLNYEYDVILGIHTITYSNKYKNFDIIYVLESSNFDFLIKRCIIDITTINLTQKINF